MTKTAMTTEEFLAAQAKPAKKKRKSKDEFLAKFLATPSREAALMARSEEEQRALFERHDAVALSMRLPLPPSMNSYWKIIQRGRMARMIVSQEGHAFRTAVVREWRRLNDSIRTRITGRLRVLVEVIARDKRKIDIDNRLKPLLDAMQHAGVFENDEQIDDLRIVRGRVQDPGFVEVIIETIGGAT